ncbi:MAG: acyl-CoA synthetase [Rhodocyclaceae bacterium]|nr:acyl-CoA synthetase [Rhodocyclaceae bacterium]
MSWISLRLGRPAGRLLLWPITGYFALFAPLARRASAHYLARALGRRPGLRDIFRHFHCFASTIHDRVYLLADRFDLFEIEIEGEASMRRLVDSGQGALLFGAHLGSFEVVRAIGRRLPGLAIALTMFEDNARKIKQTLEAINPAARPHIIPLGRLDTMLQVRDALDQGRLVGLLADRSLEADATRDIDLLGDNARIPLGAFRMAAVLRRRVIFMAGLYLGGNRYRIRFVEIADFGRIERAGRNAAIDAAVGAYVAELERCCRQAPYNWFNFYDFWAEPGGAGA